MTIIKTETGIITGGGVAAGVGIGTTMTGIVEGKEVIAIEAGAVVQVQTMIETVVWGSMMTSGGGAGANLLRGYWYSRFMLVSLCCL